MDFLVGDATLPLQTLPRDPDKQAPSALHMFSFLDGVLGIWASSSGSTIGNDRALKVIRSLRIGRLTCLLTREGFNSPFVNQTSRCSLEQRNSSCCVQCLSVAPPKWHISSVRERRSYPCRFGCWYPSAKNRPWVMGIVYWLLADLQYINHFWTVPPAATSSAV